MYSMKQICLDFKNRFLAIRTNSQDGTENMFDIQKPVLLEFIDKKVYMSGDNFTLDFENDKIYVNKSVEYDASTGALYDVSMFVPAEEYDAPGLGEKFHKVIDKLGYAEAQWNEREMDYLNTIEFFANLEMSD